LTIGEIFHVLSVPSLTIGEIYKHRATDGEQKIVGLQIFEKEPHVRQREVARRVGIIQSSVCRIDNENKFHPYHHLGPRA
jgi:hypothetical protein